MCVYVMFIPDYFRSIILRGDVMQFKIQKTEYVNRTFRISKELADRLSQVAQQEGVSVNELVVQSCEYALANMHKNSGKE